MNDLGIIDRFMETFSRYIDSGFGLLSGDVAFLTTILIGIDITLAGLFWALGGEDNIIERLIRKVLYVGVFALNYHLFNRLPYGQDDFAAIDVIEELSIGHAIIGRAVFSGLDAAVRDMLAIIRQAEMTV